jgi:hypothetical protein
LVSVIHPFDGDSALTRASHNFLWQRKSPDVYRQILSAHSWSVLVEVLVEADRDSEKMVSVSFALSGDRLCQRSQGTVQPQWWQWNGKLKVDLPASEESRGGERGSWSPWQDVWATHARRLDMTCCSLFCLEVAYRHVRRFSHEDDF